VGKILFILFLYVLVMGWCYLLGVFFATQEMLYRKDMRFKKGVCLLLTLVLIILTSRMLQGELGVHVLLYVYGLDWYISLSAGACAFGYIARKEKLNNKNSDEYEGW
jgi:hypothetical protein